MKKLTIFKQRIFTVLILFFCVFLTQCKKDIISPSPDISDPQKQLIKGEAITNLLDKLPAAQMLALDWKKSQQAIINGKRIVRVPIQNINRLMNIKLPNGLYLNENIREDKTMGVKGQASGIPSETKVKNPNYFESHPPELFFVQRENSNRVNAFLLNFIPKDINKEFGQNNIWTGSLYEWDLTGDTLIVQDIIKNELKDRYGLTKPSEENAISNLKSTNNSKLLNLKDKKVSSFFGWLIDKFADAIGWLADKLGVPTEPDTWMSYGNGGVRIAWSKIFPPGEQTTIDYIAGDEVYGSFMNGYGGTNSNFNSYPNPEGGEAFIHNSVIYLAQALDLGSHPNDKYKLDFLAENVTKSIFLTEYLQTNGRTAENIEFVYWCIDYLMSDIYFDVSSIGAVEKLKIFKNLTLNADQKNYVKANSADAIELANILEIESFSSEAKQVAQITINAALAGAFTGALTQAQHFAAINSAYPNIQTTADIQSLMTYINMQCIVIRAQNPGYSNFRVYWEATQEAIHLMLDGIGLVPGVGEVADLINGGIYTIQGDGVNASLSFASAIPIAGWFSTGAKFAKKGVLTFVVKADNVISFGNRGQLRTIIGLRVGDPRQAHHIIPWARGTINGTVQRAAKSAGAFHMNDALNGIAIAAWRNQPNHNLYDDKVMQRLNMILNSNPTPQQAHDQITALIDNIRTAIINNPDKHLNDLVF